MTVWINPTYSVRTVLIFISLMACEASSANNWEVGKRFYQQGLLADGSTAKIVVQGDIEVDSTLINCASCHRRSGLGEGEGGNYVPPITGPVIFSDYLPERQHIFRNLYQDVQSPRTRAQVHKIKQRHAYTETTLGKLLAHGINSNGMILSPQMPRFQIDKATLKGLHLYLQTLGRHTKKSLQASGVEAETLHFATVFTPDVSEPEKSAINAVFEAYIRRKNLNTLGALRKPNYSSAYKSDFVYAQRKWKLHEWQLTGPETQWSDQLATFMKSQPVFAVLGGKGSDWRTIHQFCERQLLPCLFPNTAFPLTDEVGQYTLYFSQGLIGEAKSLAKHLAQQTNTKSVSQVYRVDSSGEIAANVLRQALPKHIQIEDIELDTSLQLKSDFWQKQSKRKTWVLWLNRDELTTLPNLQAAQVFASASILDLRNKFPSNNLLNNKMAGDRLLLIWPWALPEKEPRRLYRARTWMRSRNVAMTHELEQLNTFFALNLADYATHELLDRFSRDYFIEIAERITENALNPGLYKTMSLGPGQRFAVRGNSIIPISELKPRDH